MANLSSGLVVLVVSLLVGGAAIYLGAAFALKGRDYSHAVFTAGLGAIAWTLTEWGLALAHLDVGPLPSLLSLVVWAGVIRWRYRASWLRAGLIGVFAWFAALFVLTVLASVGLEAVGAYGVPGA